MERIDMVGIGNRSRRDDHVSCSLRIGRRIELEGTVQGVGMRPFIYRVAMRRELHGAIYNTARGLCAELFGPAADLDALLTAIQTEAPPSAALRSLRVTPIPVREERSLCIESSRE